MFSVREITSLSDTAICPIDHEHISLAHINYITLLHYFIEEKSQNSPYHPNYPAEIYAYEKAADRRILLNYNKL